MYGDGTYNRKTREKGKNKVGRSSGSTAHRLLQREEERHRETQRRRGRSHPSTLAQPRSPSKHYACITRRFSKLTSLLPPSPQVQSTQSLIPLTSLTYLPDPLAYQTNLLKPPSPTSHHPNKKPTSFFSFSFFSFFYFFSFFSFIFYVAILHLIPRLMPSSSPLRSLYSSSYPFLYSPLLFSSPKPAKSKAPRSLDPATRMTS